MFGFRGLYETDATYPLGGLPLIPAGGTTVIPPTDISWWTNYDGITLKFSSPVSYTPPLTVASFAYIDPIEGQKSILSGSLFPGGTAFIASDYTLGERELVDSTARISYGDNYAFPFEPLNGGAFSLDQSRPTDFTINGAEPVNLTDAIAISPTQVQFTVDQPLVILDDWGSIFSFKCQSLMINHSPSDISLIDDGYTVVVDVAEEFPAEEPIVFSIDQYGQFCVRCQDPAYCLDGVSGLVWWA